MFCPYEPNLVILPWRDDELWCRQTRGWCTHPRTHTQTDAGNDNTRRPQVALGKNCSRARWRKALLEISLNYCMPIISPIQSSHFVKHVDNCEFPIPWSVFCCWHPRRLQLSWAVLAAVSHVPCLWNVNEHLYANNLIFSWYVPAGRDVHPHWEEQLEVWDIKLWSTARPLDQSNPAQPNSHHVWLTRETRREWQGKQSEHFTSLPTGIIFTGQPCDVSALNAGKWCLCFASRMFIAFWNYCSDKKIIFVAI